MGGTQSMKIAVALIPLLPLAGFLITLLLGKRYFRTKAHILPVALVTVSAPYGRSYHSALWTGTEMLVWGGYAGASLGLGGRYSVLTGIWTSTTNTGAPPNRSGHTAVWTGSEMLVFGGTNGGYLNDTYGYSIGKTMYLYQKP